jgi:hypothetical protein
MRNTRRFNVLLWVIQALLAAVFLFGGVMKLVMPLDVLEKQSHMPGLLLRFIGLAETAGALGLILPGLTRIRPNLTPLAACGLVIIMIGATVLTVKSGQIVPALFPFTVGLLAAFVAWGRRPGALDDRIG